MGWRSLVLLLCLNAAWAQETQDKKKDEEKDTTTVRPLVDRILVPLRYHASRRPRKGDPGYESWADEYEYLRKRAVRKVLVTIRFAGPNGEGKRLDIGPGIEALLSPLLAIGDDAKMWAIAGELLALEPDSTKCWSSLKGLLNGMRARKLRGTAAWLELHGWARTLRRTAGIDGEAALAAELLAASVSYELGDRTAARRGAEAALRGDSRSEELRRDARRLRSRVSLLTTGQEAPGFRIVALREGEPEIVLDDYRGRCVLLHFWHCDDPDAAYVRIAGKCRSQLAESDLVVLTVPVYDGSEPPQDVSGKTEGFAWPVTAANHVAQDTARAYGVDGISALFLLTPDGRVIKSDPWPTGDPVPGVRKLVRQAAGPPLTERLRQAGSWPTCRALWHDLVARRQTRFADGTWRLAKQLAPPAYCALMLASAHGKGARPRTVAGEDIHERLVAAWCDLRLRGDRARWDRATAKLARPKSDECLAVVDALHDLGLWGDAVRKPLERIAARCRRWETVSMALRTIHFSDTTASPKALRRHLLAKRWQVRLALADALRAYRHKDAVDLLIQLLGDKRRRVRGRAADHLELLTAVSLGHSQKRWAKWRRKQGADLKLRPREVSVYRPFRPPERKYAHKDYYGLQIASDRVVFVLDKSDSMYYGLFDGVVEEAQAHLESAGPTTRFNVIEFADKPKPWSKELVPANRVNISAAVQFLTRDTPYGPTNIIDALRHALHTPDVGAVVLLSDGLPNRGNPSKPDRIRAAVQKENRYTRIAIHTVQLLVGRVFPHDGPRGSDIPPLDDGERDRRDKLSAWAPTSDLGAFLHRLAQENDGHYGVGFADKWKPAPGTKFRPNTDD